MDNEQLEGFVKRVIREQYLGMIREHNAKHNGATDDIQNCKHSACKRMVALINDFNTAAPVRMNRATQLGWELNDTLQVFDQFRGVVVEQGGTLEFANKQIELFCAGVRDVRLADVSVFLIDKLGFDFKST